MQVIYGNHLCRIGLKITNDVHADLHLKNKFLHLETEGKKRYLHIRCKHI